MLSWDNLFIASLILLGAGVIWIVCKMEYDDYQKNRHKFKSYCDYMSFNDTRHRKVRRGDLDDALKPIIEQLKVLNAHMLQKQD